MLARTARRVSHHATSTHLPSTGLGTVGEYQLLEKLGQGGMGEVYLARHRRSNRRCALKRIRADKNNDTTTRSRFQAEIQAMTRLTHANIVRVLDHGVTDDGTPYYVMELLNGMDLEEIVNRFGPLPSERVVDLLRQVCAALAEAHAVGLIHRDIKPANIFAAGIDGKCDLVKLLDFGLVKSSAADDLPVNVTVEGSFVGSPLYASPETTLGDAAPDARSDIYALGATAYHLLTGRPVFSGGNPLKVIFAHAQQAPTPPSQLGINLPAALEAVVLKCLEKRPVDRFASAEALDAALAAVESDQAWTPEQANNWWRDRGGLEATTPINAVDSATCLTSGDTN
jgi:serine/threonine protein kinase